MEGSLPRSPRSPRGGDLLSSLLDGASTIGGGTGAKNGQKVPVVDLDDVAMLKLGVKGNSSMVQKLDWGKPAKFPRSFFDLYLKPNWIQIIDLGDLKATEFVPVNRLPDEDEDFRKFRHQKVDHLSLAEFALRLSSANFVRLRILSLMYALVLSEENKSSIPFLKSLKNCPNLEVLDLSICGLETRPCLELGRSLKSLKFLRTLDLSENVIGDQGCTSVCWGLDGSKSLTRLSFKSNGIALRGAKAIAKLLKSISTCIHLDLSRNHLDEQSAQYLATGLVCQRDLRSFDFSKNTVLHSGGASIFSNVPVSNSNLKILMASSNYLTFGNVKCLVNELMSSNHCIRYIDLSCNEKIGDPGARELAKFLQCGSCMIEDLNLSSCNISAAGFRALGHAISLKKTGDGESLRVLNLRDNQGGDWGAIELGSTLENFNCKLEVLNIAHNFIGLKGLLQLLESLKSNDTLTELILGDNRFITQKILKSTKKQVVEKEIMDALDYCISQNSRLHRIDFADQNTLVSKDLLKGNRKQFRTNGLQVGLLCVRKKLEKFQVKEQFSIFANRIIKLFP
jgi:Ran GTPase-activating protein (RanGAP) involved in mRNA processing and transport